ncbi:GldG family protein [Moorena producens]|uniref:GldG family protein n=1 Tax=Moorena producens TaxID=1155739 RepID=UPI003C742047
MKTSKTKKYLLYLFWLGPLLTMAGITVRIMTEKWSPDALGLLIAGIVISLVGLVFLARLAPKFWQSRSTQVGTNAIISTVAMLVILGLINFIGVRYTQRIDLTENQLYTLSPQSQQVVQNLRQPLKVWIFNPQPNPDDRELLENFRRYGSNFEFQFVDPQLKPALAQKFGVQSIGEVYLQYKDKQQLLQAVNDTQPLSEASLTSGIETLTREISLRVYFLQGHGEKSLAEVEGGLSEAVRVLEDKNFTVQPLNLAERSEVPADASIVVSAGPMRPLLEKEVKGLRNYLSKGGSLLLMLDPDTNPKLDSFLKDWGINLDSRLVIDPSAPERSLVLGAATPMVTSYGNHPITREFADGFSFYPWARSLLITPVDGIQETPLLITNDRTWAESNPKQQPLELNPERDRPGPLILGVALSRKAEGIDQGTPQEDGNKKTSSARLVVYGNSNFATNGWFDQQLNGDVFLNTISWLSKQDDQVLSIRPKEQNNRRINLTAIQAELLGWTALLLMPLVGFTTAGLVWWQRR